VVGERVSGQGSPFRRALARAARLTTVAVVGLALVVAGIILMPLPGPGLLVVIAGLAVLATEFAWARRLLDYARERAKRVQARVWRR
jgi:uncharacterized protein (TIGR02611 family)